MRKWLGSMGLMLLMAGLLIAAEGTISKVYLDKKAVTIKEGDKDNFLTAGNTNRVKPVQLVECIYGGELLPVSTTAWEVNPMRASEIVLDGFQLRTDAKIVRHPDR